MRIAVLLAAVAALWVQPAHAVATWTFNIRAHVTGTNTPNPPLGVIEIPVDTTLEFYVNLRAFETTSDLEARIVSLGIFDPTGLGGYRPILTGSITLHDYAIHGTNFAYNGGPAEGGLLCLSCAHYDLHADTFSVGFLGASDGPGPVPEPATWAMMLVGFFVTGAALRRLQRQQRQARFTFA